MRRTLAGVLVLFLIAVGITACGSSSGESEAGKGEKLTAGMFIDFSGPAGEQANIVVAGCAAATGSINAAGGILGHEIGCERFDAGADPADAVPAASRMLSGASNLAFTLGPEEVASATAPIISAQKIVMLSASGDPHFNENDDPFFYRIVPADNVAGQAQAYWAYKSGFKNVAMLFENGSGALTVIEPVKEGLEKLGVNVTANLKVAPDQSSYRTEVQSLLASHPEAILSETDPQTAATFFSELLELNGGQMIPLQGTPATVVSSYEEPLVRAIGAENVEKYFEGTTVAAAEPGPALSEYQKYLLQSGSEVPEPELYKNEPYSTAFYDSSVATALAMVAAKSTSPEKFQGFLTKVTGSPGQGKVEVHTFAEGKKALEAGKQIVYMGTNGPIIWNQFHNREGAFQALAYNPAERKNEVRGTITPQELKQAMGE